MVAPLEGLSEREKHIAAAAYLKGLATGLAMDRTERWHKRRLQKSVLGERYDMNTIGNLLEDGRSFNPLAIYEVAKLAEECGLAQNHRHATLAVAKLLEPK